MKRIGVLLGCLLLCAITLSGQSVGRITGRVLDDVTGAGVANAQVYVARRDGPAEFTRTDAAGGFVLESAESERPAFGAWKAGYVLRLVTVGSEEKASGITIRLVPMAVVTGRILDRDGEPMERVTVNAFRYSFLDGERQLAVQGSAAYTNDRGEYRLYDLNAGDYYVGVSYRPNMGFALGVEGAAAYRPLFYPGVTEPAQAGVIRLRPGEVRQGIDLRMIPENSYSVRGLLVDGRNGGPAGRIRISIRPGSTLAVPPYSSDTQAISSMSGEFEILGLTRGEYIVECVNMDDGDQRLYAMARIQVVSSDIEDLKLVLTPPATIRGGLTIEGTSVLPEEVTQIQVVLTPAVRSLRLAAGSAGTVQRDGSFVIESLVAAPYQLEVYGMPDAFYLKSARYGDADALASGISLQGGAALDLRLTLSQRPARLSGVVQDESSDPVADAKVLLMPALEGVRGAQLYKRAETDDGGRFEIRGITPGPYSVLALDEAPFGAERDPMLVEIYRNQVDSVRVGEGEQRSVDLRIARSDGR